MFTVKIRLIGHANYHCVYQNVELIDLQESFNLLSLFKHDNGDRDALVLTFTEIPCLELVNNVLKVWSE